MNIAISHPHTFSLSHLNLAVALGAGRSDKLLEAVLAVQVALLLDESNVGQLATTISVHADKVVRAPDTAQSSDEWTPREEWMTSQFTHHPIDV